MGINEVREFPGCRGGYLLLPIVQKQHEAEKERTNERDKKRDNKGGKKQYRRCHAKKQNVQQTPNGRTKKKQVLAGIEAGRPCHETLKLASLDMASPYLLEEN